MKDRILFVNDRSLSVNDHISSVKIVYFQSQSYNFSEDRKLSIMIVYMSKIVYFTTQSNSRPQPNALFSYKNFPTSLGTTNLTLQKLFNCRLSNLSFFSNYSFQLRVLSHWMVSVINPWLGKSIDHLLNHYRLHKNGLEVWKNVTYICTLGFWKIVAWTWTRLFWN